MQSEKLKRFHTVSSGTSEEVSHRKTLGRLDTQSGAGFSAERMHYDSSLRQPVQHAKLEGARKDNAGAGLPSTKHPHRHNAGSIKKRVTRPGKFQRGLSAADAREEARQALISVAKQIHERDGRSKKMSTAWQAFDEPQTAEGIPHGSGSEQQQQTGADSVRPRILRHSSSIVTEDNCTHYTRYLRD